MILGPSQNRLRTERNIALINIDMFGAQYNLALKIISQDMVIIKAIIGPVQLYTLCMKMISIFTTQ